MTRRSEQFFQRLASVPQPLLQGVQATLRIDVEGDRGDVEHWMLRMDDGYVRVSRRDTRADAVIRTDQVMLDRLLSGEANALTARLRGRIRMEGNVRVCLAFARLLPSPPGRRTTLPPSSRTAREAARSGRSPGTSTRTARSSPAVASMTRKGR